ncbi:hypothetical protein ASF23_10620 [Curtobacterium sp. Leaf261]|nr:hypothetical protein ASF23_10620 [Curtobacterium sp. Leaf261]
MNAWSLIRSFHAAAVASLAVSAGLLVVYGLAMPSVHVVPGLLALVPTAVMMGVHARFGTWRSAAAFLLVGGVSAVWFAAVVESQLGDADYVVSYLVSLAIIPLVLVGGAGARPGRVIAWSVVGFAVGRVATVIGAELVGGRVEPAVLAWLTMVLVIGIVGFGTRVTARLQRIQPEFLRSAREEHVAAYRQRMELEAAAILHDTVLNHLNAIAVAPSGPMDDHLARAVDADVSMLVSREWLVPGADTSPRGSSTGAGFAGADRSIPDGPAAASCGGDALTAVVEAARSAEFDVDLTGNTSAIARLDPETGTALARAVAQCLANVQKHAETDCAEVSVFDDESTCTVMVVDDGRGFEESATAADRLGLKNSVRQRVERVGGSVQVWSSPGTGTSVMMTVPFPTTPADVPEVGRLERAS